MGSLQAKEAMLGEVGVGPAAIGQTVPDPGLAATFEKDIPQASPDPAVEVGKGRGVAVLEVAEPASEGLIHVGDDLREAVAAVAARLRAKGLLKLRERLLARPSSDATILRG